jgi:single-strand DNA-binding protein
MYQKVIIAGNLGRDPEMRYLQDGTPVTSFSVATNRVWTNADGSRSEEVCWFRVTAWRRQAEACAEYLSKGRPVLIEGRMTPDRDTGGPRVWVGNDGTPRASYEITSDRVVFLGGGEAREQQEPERPEEVAEDEIPF